MTTLAPPMLIVPAERLLPYSPDELFENLSGTFILRFSDGDLVTNERECWYTSYMWEFFRRYPETPLKKTHHLKDLNGDNETTAGAHLKLIGRCFFSVYDAYCALNIDRTKLLDDLCRLTYEVTNRLYNDATTKLEEYVTSLDILDFISVVKSEAIGKALSELEPSEEGIASIGKLIQTQLKTNPDFKENPLAVAIRTGISRMGQALQCLGPRGFLTDVDSDIFTYPVTASYVDGIRTLYGSMIESRSAAKSLINSTKPLQDSEYFSRRQQLICQGVKNLHFGDCGSTQYLLWPVRGVRYEGSTKISNGDLSTIAGKYYMDDDNQLKVVRANDDHLIGRTLKLRSVVAGCQHSDPYGVCEVCYGETALAVPANSNLGHIACVSMTALLGQLILSTKHFDGSSVVEGIVLKPTEKKYLAADLNGNCYYLNEKLKTKSVKFYINTLDAPGLPDIKLVNDVHNLSSSRVSEFPKVLISVTDAKGTELTSLDVCVNARLSSLSHDFLRHIKKAGYAITDENMYEFDMHGWDYTKPMFTLPMTHVDMASHQSKFENCSLSPTGC